MRSTRVFLQVLATFKAGEPAKVRTEDGEVNFSSSLFFFCRITFWTHAHARARTRFQHMSTCEVLLAQEFHMH